MSKNNVHPDHYKVGGRDRQDDAAAPRQARAMAAKASSGEHPDRMSKGLYFQRPEPAQTSPATRRMSSKSSVTQSKESSAPRSRRKPVASSTRNTGRSAKKKAPAASTRSPAKKR